MDKDEEELMDSIEQDQWRSVSNLYDEQQKAKIAAKNTLKKDKRINLRLSQRDYQQIQIKAVEEGMPYQTLIASILHKYLNDSLSTK